jgi:hypothetical protein
METLSLDSRQRVLVRAYQYVVHLVFGDLCSKIDVDFYSLFRVFGLNSFEQAMKPLGGAKVADDPDKVYLAQSCLPSVAKVVHPVPYRF